MSKVKRKSKRYFESGNEKEVWGIERTEMETKSLMITKAKKKTKTKSIKRT